VGLTLRKALLREDGGKVEVQLQTFLTSAPDGGGGQLHALVACVVMKSFD
jgi:hypothetical protein